MKISHREIDYESGKALQALRNKIGLTQTGLAEHLGVSGRTVRAWEAGSRYPKAEYLKAFIALAVQSQVFTEGCEAEEIRMLWKTSHRGRLLDEHWLSALLSGPATLERAKGVPPHEGQRTPEIQNLPFPPNPFFTGRESELGLLSRLFEQNERIAITQPISVSGLGGIGKTQLALEYAHRCYPNVYQCVFFVNADDRATLSAGYISLAHLLKLPERNEREVERIVQAVKIWLEEHTHWLLILDNADDLELARSYLPTRPRGHILLTTRSQIVGDMATLLQVPAMSPQEGLLFLLRRSGLLKSGSSLSSLASDICGEAEALVEILAGHPLALDQAGAYIEETRDPNTSATSAPLTAYRQLYRQQRHFLLKSRSSFAGRHPESVALTLEISMQKACELHPSCTDILAFCSLLHPDAIPEEMLCQEAGLGLHLHHFNEAIRALRRYSLVKRDAEKKILSIHRLVQAVSRDAMESQTLRQWTERVLRAVNAAFPEAEFPQWSRCEQVLPHVQLCATWIEGYSIVEAEAASLLHKAGRYLWERGQYADVEPLQKLALSIRKQHLGPLHPDTARSLNNLAILYSCQGKYEQAEPLYKQALAIHEQHLGTSHPDRVTSLNNLAELYRKQGRYEQAEPLYRRALAICEQHLGASHPITAGILNNLALLYRKQGRDAQAESLYQRAISIQEQHLGTEHPNTASSLYNLAMLYQQQGKYEQAEPLHKRALAIREQYLGVEHPNTAGSLHGLAELSQHQGKHEQASALYQRALCIREQCLGETHPETENTRRAYATFLRLVERDESATVLGTGDKLSVEEGHK